MAQIQVWIHAQCWWSHREHHRALSDSLKADKYLANACQGNARAIWNIHTKLDSAASLPSSEWTRWQHRSGHAWQPELRFRVCYIRLELQFHSAALALNWAHSGHFIRSECRSICNFRFWQTGVAKLSQKCLMHLEVKWQSRSRSRSHKYCHSRCQCKNPICRPESVAHRAFLERAGAQFSALCSQGPQEPVCMSDDCTHTHILGRQRFCNGTRVRCWNWSVQFVEEWNINIHWFSLVESSNTHFLMVIYTINAPRGEPSLHYLSPNNVYQSRLQPL